MKKFLFIASTLLLFGSISSCNVSNNSEIQNKETYTVHFVTNGGELDMDYMIINPNDFEGLPTPKRDNFYFIGWFLDEDFTTPFNKKTKYKDVITVYAKWEPSEVKEIGNAGDFENISLSGRYKLTNNIDFNGKEISSIGTRENPFNGIIDGNGFTISNFSIKNNTYNSLFGYFTGEIKNLNITNSLTVITNSNTYVSLLIGHAYKAKIENCFVQGSISLTSTSMEEASIVGGLIGYSEISEISHCYSQTNITVNSPSTSFVGGLVGYNGGGNSQESTISNCFTKSAIINVNATNDRASAYSGGVVGCNFGTITKCFSHDVEISAKTKSYYAFAGGVVADNNGGYVSNCLGVSNVNVSSESGNTFRGLVIGRNFKSTDDKNNGTFSNCYGSSISKSTYSIDSKYASITTHEQVVVDIAYLSDLKSSEWYKTTLQLEGFYIKDNYFPSLNTEFKKINYNVVSGSIENPISITSSEQLSNIDMNKSYILENDLVINENWKPLGTYFEPFRGTFDGNNHTISISINKETSSVYNGLFGYTNALIKNLNVNLNISFIAESSNIQYIGAICSYATKSIIKNCSSLIDSNVTSNGQISGGLIGILENSYLIHSYSNGSIKGTSTTNSAYFGGLVGESSSSEIKESYSKVNLDVSGNSFCYVGGLLGKNLGIVTDTYAISSINVKHTTNTVYEGGLIGFSKKGELLNSYSKVILTCEATPSTKLLGGISGYNNQIIDNCYYNVNKEVLYSSGHSPVFVNVKRVDDEELKSLSSSLSNYFYDGSDNVPHLIFEKGNK